MLSDEKLLNAAGLESAYPGELMVVSIKNLRAVAEAAVQAEREGAEPDGQDAIDMLDQGKLWSFLRTVMDQGSAIWQDYEGKHRELYHARLDAAASERADELLFMLERTQASATVPEGWQAMETAPKNGKPILVTDGINCAAVYWWPFVWMGTTHNGMKHPTHWMPLPAVPSSPPGSQPDAGKYGQQKPACRCFNDEQRKLCADKRNCIQYVAEDADKAQGVG